MSDQKEPYVDGTVDPPELVCPNCENRFPLDLPMSAKAVGREMIVFANLHGKCEKDE